MSFIGTFRPVLLGLLMAAACLAAGTSQANSKADLFDQLCQLNQNWLERTPDYSVLPAGWSSQGETSLIQTHLRLVIDQLEQADVSQLTADQMAQRQQHIETLRGYMERGEFPRNIFVPGRRPVFIDPWGTHCAVGYLIATSGNEALANAINEEHRLDYLGDIQTTGLADWQIASGLSLAELALIQPSYVYRELNYPKEVEDLILGDSAAIIAAIEKDPTLIDARCGGKTLLHFAATVGDLELCKLLVERGADINAVSSLAFEPKKPEKAEPEEAKPGQVRIGIRSSSTIYNVRWNEMTEVNRNGRRGIGQGGRVFRLRTGWAIAGVFNDMRGGVEGKTALYFASNGVRMPPGLPNREPDAEFQKLIDKRAEVAAWLVEQGAM